MEKNRQWTLVKQGEEERYVTPPASGSRNKTVTPPTSLTTLDYRNGNAASPSSTFSPSPLNLNDYLPMTGSSPICNGSYRGVVTSPASLTPMKGFSLHHSALTPSPCSPANSININNFINITYNNNNNGSSALSPIPLPRSSLLGLSSSSKVSPRFTPPQSRCSQHLQESSSVVKGLTNNQGRS